MDKISIAKGRTLHRSLWLVGFVLVSLFVVVGGLPRNSAPQMRYDVDKPWMYGSLIAKFDFPVYKTDEVIKKEQDSMLQLFQPYYNYDKEVEKQQLEQLRKDFPNGIPGLPKGGMHTLIDRLHRLYQAGIISAAVQQDGQRLG